MLAAMHSIVSPAIHERHRDATSWYELARTAQRQYDKASVASAGRIARKRERGHGGPAGVLPR
jgi:hypothetical protein